MSDYSYLWDYGGKLISEIKDTNIHSSFLWFHLCLLSYSSCCSFYLLTDIIYYYVAVGYIITCGMCSHTLADNSVQLQFFLYFSKLQKQSSQDAFYCKDSTIAQRKPQQSADRYDPARGNSGKKKETGRHLQQNKLRDRQSSDMTSWDWRKKLRHRHTVEESQRWIIATDEMQNGVYITDNNGILNHLNCTVPNHLACGHTYQLWTQKFQNKFPWQV